MQAQNSAIVVLLCTCGAAQIPAPVGSTAATVFTCRACCARIQRQKNIQSLLARRGGLPIGNVAPLSFEQSEHTQTLLSVESDDQGDATT